MKTQENTATVELDINASPEKVWNGLTDPRAVKEYMMGAKVETDWKEGSPISWKGEFKGKAFEDKGKVLRVIKGERLAYSHISPGPGMEDKAENYRMVDIQLFPRNHGTHLKLSQDNNASDEARSESERNWKMMMEGLKKVVER